MKPLDRINGYAHVAARYGLEEAIFLDSLMYWYKENRANGRNFQDGRWWTYNSVSAFVQLFPWWSAKQLRRITERCREKGAILDGNYNENPRDRTLWYTPSDELLELYGMSQSGNCICPNGQNDLPERANGSAQTGKSYKEHVNTHVDTMNTPHTPQRGMRVVSKPKYRPEWFERFWKLYPRRTNRMKAVNAWDKLQPDLELCKIMADAIHAQIRSEQWQNPQHIPHPSTWLNGARWLDEICTGAPDCPQPPRRTGRLTVDENGEEVVVFD